MTNRSVLSVVLLSIFTCGIYQIYWMCVTTNELNQEDAQEPLMHYLLAWLLGIVTCGIYFIYWHYKFYKKMDFVTGKDNCSYYQSSSVLLLVLQFHKTQWTK